MTADAVNLLAEIRRLGGDVKLVSCDKLKLVAPSALMPELIKRVRVAKPMLLAVLADNTSRSRGMGRGCYTPGATVQQRNTHRLGLYGNRSFPYRLPNGTPAIVRRWPIGAPFTLPTRPRRWPGAKLRTGGTDYTARDGRLGNAPAVTSRLAVLRP
jgi:hypothetical protein